MSKHGVVEITEVATLPLSRKTLDEQRIIEAVASIRQHVGDAVIELDEIERQIGPLSRELSDARLFLRAGLLLAKAHGHDGRWME